MNDLKKIEEGFRQAHAVSVASMAQIIALTELVEELATRASVTSIHGHSIKEGLRRRADEIGERLQRNLGNVPPTVGAILDEVEHMP